MMRKSQQPDAVQLTNVDLERSNSCRTIQSSIANVLLYKTVFLLNETVCLISAQFTKKHF